MHDSDTHRYYWVSRHPLIQVVPDTQQDHRWRIVTLNGVVVPFEAFIDSRGYVSRVIDGVLHQETASVLPHDEVQLTVGLNIFMLPTPIPAASIQVLPPETFAELLDRDDPHHVDAF